MSNQLDRRQLLVALAAAGALPGCANSKPAVPVSGAFRHGVASGDPGTDSIVLWTRISGVAAPVSLTWEVSAEPSFETVLLRGEADTSAEADYTVKVVAGPLPAGLPLYYRFSSAGEISPTGRTRLFKAQGEERIGIALASCSNFAFGYFNAYDAIARDPGIDLVLHTGDYIYEYGAGEWGDETGITLGRRHEPPHEIVSLADYRTRHAQYKTDAGAQAMHAAHPFVACWDDHEVTNNPWTGGAQNHQDKTEGDYATRRAAALQAYYEWMPVRDPGPGGTREAFWRSYQLGGLATLVTLESRHTGRDRQVDYSEHYASIQNKATRDGFMQDIIGDPARRMLSTDMETFFEDAMARSVERGEPWRLVGNASPIARMLVPDLEAAGIPEALAPASERIGAGPNLFWKGKWNLPFYTDTWDGYPAARERLYAVASAARANDLIFLTGDSHSFWENPLFDAGGRSVGLEIGTAGISSPGDFVETGWIGDAPEQLNALFSAALPEVNWTEDRHQGYVRIELTASEARSEFLAVSTCLSTEYRLSRLRKSVIRRVGGNLEVQAV
jgi:phosphodiesterase/alkaline phosphatase D-like protein